VTGTYYLHFPDQYIDKHKNLFYKLKDK